MSDEIGVKINSRSPTKYKPIEMTDDEVYDMALHQYTLEKIAEKFNVSPTTVLVHHGDAFKAGKYEIPKLPRKLLNKIMKDFDSDELNFARTDVPVERLMKAIELYWKKYEGLGKNAEEAVEEERPSVSDIKFDPL